jgi:hypothetical protein
VKGNAGETLIKKNQERSSIGVNQASIKKQLSTLVSNLSLLQLRPDEGIAMRAQVDALTAQSKRLEEQLNILDKEIHVVENQQINRQDLKGIFKDFADIYRDAPPETKHRLLNVIFEEIRCSVKRGENTGEIVYKLTLLSG